MLEAQDDYLVILRRLISEAKCLDKFLTSSGCCVICFNSNPLILEEHHPFGRVNSSVTITVCANHHRLLSLLQRSWPADWLRKTANDPIVRETITLQSFSDLEKVSKNHWEGNE